VLWFHYIVGIKALRSQAGLLGFIALGLPFDAINFAEIEATHVLRFCAYSYSHGARTATKMQRHLNPRPFQDSRYDKSPMIGAVPKHCLQVKQLFWMLQDILRCRQSM